MASVLPAKEAEAQGAELKAFEGRFRRQARVERRLVSRNASEIRRARRSHLRRGAVWRIPRVAGEWREVSEAAAAVPYLSPSIVEHDVVSRR